MLFGFGASVIAGMLYRIVPLIVWLHLQNRMREGRMARGTVPHVKLILPESRLFPQVRVHALALALLLLAAVWPDAFSHAAAIAAGFSFGVLAWILLVACRPLRAPGRPH